MSERVWFDAARFEELRAASGATWGRPVRAFDSTPSTNDLALEAISGDARTGIVWIAREQTHGRGRRGNPWVARTGDALLMTTLLRWPAPIQGAAGLGLAAGLAVLEACQKRIEAPLGVKWPNDVIAARSKLSGILIESRPDGRGSLGIAVGIGVNVRAIDFDPAAGAATSLALLGANEEGLALEPLLLDLLLGLERLIPLVLSGKLDRVVAEVRRVDALAGRRIRIAQPSGDALPPLEEGSIVGVARGISASGQLEVETSRGLAYVSTGHVLFD